MSFQLVLILGLLVGGSAICPGSAHGGERGEDVQAIADALERTVRAEQAVCIQCLVGAESACRNLEPQDSEIRSLFERLERAAEDSAARSAPEAGDVRQLFVSGRNSVLSLYACRRLARDPPVPKDHEEIEDGIRYRTAVGNDPCETSADCVPASCCNPRACVAAENQPVGCESRACSDACLEPEIYGCFSACRCFEGSCSARMYMGKASVVETLGSGPDR